VDWCAGPLTAVGVLTRLLTCALNALVGQLFGVYGESSSEAEDDFPEADFETFLEQSGQARHAAVLCVARAFLPWERLAGWRLPLCLMSPGLRRVCRRGGWHAQGR
jgi:hypothetical protein